MQYCSLQHWTLLPSPVTSTTGCCFCFGSVSSFFLELVLHWSSSHNEVSNQRSITRDDEASGNFHKPLILLHLEGRHWKPQSQKLSSLITWTTALSNSMKLWAMLCRAIQERQVMVESSDRMWSTGEGNGKPLQYSCLENAMNSMKRQKDRTLKEELPRLVGAHWRSVEK